MDPRPYQQAAIDAIWSSLRAKEPAPLVCLPTGAGKSLVVAKLCAEAAVKWKGRVLVLVHVKELVQQLADAIRAQWPEKTCPLGVLSAGLGSKTIDQVTVAGIQSAYRRGVEFGKINLVICDESHLVPPDGDGMYRTLLSDLRAMNPDLKLAGLTATPYRLGFGLVYGEGAIFSNLVYEAKVRDLMEQGYLCRVRGKGSAGPDLSRVHHRGGEFVAQEVDAIMEDQEKVDAAVREILTHGSDRRAWLVFCCSVKHAGMVRAALVQAGVDSEVITGETPGGQRDMLIARFKGGGLRCLVNVNVLTTGFDSPHVDLVVLLRPTESPGLYYQMVGRGFRIHPDKTDCMLLDLAGNITRHGPIETLSERLVTPGGGEAPVKFCEQCAEQNATAAATCVACGAPFFRTCPHCGESRVPWTADTCITCLKPLRIVARHDTVAAEGDPINAEAPEPVWSGEITSVEYDDYAKRGVPEACHTLCVTYYSGYDKIGREWVCLDHSGFALSKARAWVASRLRPGVILDAGQLIDADGHEYDLTVATAAAHGDVWFRPPTKVATIPDGKWTRVVNYHFDAQSEQEAAEILGKISDAYADHDLPF